MLAQKLPLELMQTQWAQELNPLISNPTTKTTVLKNINLVTGTNVINHKLGRALQGWYLVRIRAATTVYDTQDANQTPTLTLVLNASAPAIVDLVVF